MAYADSLEGCPPDDGHPCLSRMAYADSLDGCPPDDGHPCLSTAPSSSNHSGSASVTAVPKARISATPFAIMEVGNRIPTTASAD